MAKFTPIQPFKSIDLFGGGASKASNPYKAAQTTVTRSIARIKATGHEPPELTPSRNLLFTVLDILDRPGAFVRGAVKAALTPEKESILGEAWAAFTGKKRVTGEDVLEAAGISPKNKLANWLLSTATEIVLDPTTYLTLGASSAAKSVGQSSVEALSKRIMKEVAEETGQKITEKSALRLAENALKGSIPVGRLGTAVQRALGREAKTEIAESAIEAISKRAAKIEAEKLFGKKFSSSKKLKSALESLIKHGSPPSAMEQKARRLIDTLYKRRENVVKALEKLSGTSDAAAVEAATKALQNVENMLDRASAVYHRLKASREAADAVKIPTARKLLQVLTREGAPRAVLTKVGGEATRYTLNVGDVLGFSKKPLVEIDITNMVKAAEDKMIKRLGEPGRKIVDVLGRIFVKDYTPLAYRGVQRSGIQAAKEVIAETERKAPVIARQTMEEVLQRWKKEGFSEDIRKIATYVLEEPNTPAAKAVKKAERDVEKARIALEKAREKIRQHFTEKVSKQRQKIDKILKNLDEVEKAMRKPGISPKEDVRLFKQSIKLRNELNKAQIKLNQILNDYEPPKRLKQSVDKKYTNYTLKQAILKDKMELLENQRLRHIGRKDIPEEAVRAAAFAKNIFDESANKLTDMGVSLNVIDNYVYHLYKDPPEKVKKIIDRWRTKKGVSAATPPFVRARVIPTIVEAKELGLTPVEDAAVLTAIHRAMTEQLSVLEKMGRELLNIGTDFVRPATNAPSNWVRFGDSAVPLLKNLAVHPEVATSLNRLFNIITNPDEANKILDRIYSTVMRNVKAAMTSWNPSYHVRNFMGNIFLNTVDGVTPDAYEKALKILSGKNITIRSGDRKYTADIVRKLFEQEGLVGQGMFRRFESAPSLLRQAETLVKDLGMTPRTRQETIKALLRGPTDVGILTDSLSRMASFIHHLERGMSPRQAAARVRAVLYDYGALTPQERWLSRYVIPFYAWVRFNIPAMLRLLATRPGVFTAINHIIESGKSAYDMKPEGIPEWVRDMMAVPVGVTEDGEYVFVNLGIPPSDLARIALPPNWPEMSREIVNMLNPLFTIPLQIAVNKNFFTGDVISKYEDLPMARLRDSLVFALTRVGMGREIASAHRILSSRATGKELAVTPLPGLGTLLMTVKPEVVQRQNLYRLRNLLLQYIDWLESQGVHVPTYEQLQKKAE